MTLRRSGLKNRRAWLGELSPLHEEQEEEGREDEEDRRRDEGKEIHIEAKSESGVSLFLAIQICGEDRDDAFNGLCVSV